jgi:hypothetical protein
VFNPDIKENELPIFLLNGYNLSLRLLSDLPWICFYKDVLPSKLNFDLS